VPAERVRQLLEGVDAHELPAVLAGAGQPVPCRDVVAALGEDPLVARRDQPVRHRLTTR
jgi:hypothetical protein